MTGVRGEDGKYFEAPIEKWESYFGILGSWADTEPYAKHCRLNNGVGEKVCEGQIRYIFNQGYGMCKWVETGNNCNGWQPFVSTTYFIHKCFSLVT